MLVLRTSNFQGATIRPIVPRHKHSIVFIVHHRIAFCMRMRCWCGGNVQGVCPSFILALLISVFFAIFHMEAPENTQEFFSIAFL